MQEPEPSPAWSELAPGLGDVEGETATASNLGARRRRDHSPIHVPYFGGPL